MKTVTIYSRFVKQNGNKCLAMVDSNGNGAIDNLETEVQGGDTIIWKLDNLSGITPYIDRITDLKYKDGDTEVFENGVTHYYKGFKLQAPVNTAGRDLKAKYIIECKLSDNSSVTIDPYIRVPPPPGG